jgi:hypothetical protein
MAELAAGTNRLHQPEMQNETYEEVLHDKSAAVDLGITLVSARRIGNHRPQAF